MDRNTNSDRTQAHKRRFSLARGAVSVKPPLLHLPPTPSSSPPRISLPREVRPERAARDRIPYEPEHDETRFFHHRLGRTFFEGNQDWLYQPLFEQLEPPCCFEIVSFDRLLCFFLLRETGDSGPPQHDARRDKQPPHSATPPPQIPRDRSPTHRGYHPRQRIVVEPINSFRP